MTDRNVPPESEDVNGDVAVEARNETVENNKSDAIPIITDDFTEIPKEFGQMYIVGPLIGAGTH